MYKRLLLVIILLLLCITISIGSFFTVSYISEDLTEELENFLIYAEEDNEILTLVTIDNCIEKLNSYEKIYAIFLDHSLFESLMIAVPSIKHLYETGNSDEAMDKCFESIETLKIIVHEQKPSFENVF